MKWQEAHVCLAHSKELWIQDLQGHQVHCVHPTISPISKDHEHSSHADTLFTENLSFHDHYFLLLN